MKKSEALIALSEQLGAIEELKRQNTDQASFDAWRLRCAQVLERILADEAEAFAAISFEPTVVLDVNEPLGAERTIAAARQAGLKVAMHLLERALRQVEERENEADDPPREPNEIAQIIVTRLMAFYAEHSGNRNWSITSTSFRSVGVTDKEAAFNLNRLRDKGLVKPFAMGGQYKLETYGVDVGEDPGALERLFPINRRKKSAFGGHSDSMSDESVPKLAALLELVGDMDTGFRELISNDLKELGAAINNGMHKTVMIFCGSLLEAVLIDVLDRRRDVCGTYMPVRKKFPDEASLSDLLRIAASPNLAGEGRTLISADARKMGDIIKDHRDLIHPHRIARQNSVIDSHQANAVLALLRLVVRELGDAAKNGTIEAFVNK